MAAALSAAVQVQRWSLGTPRMTCCLCWPHPAHVRSLQDRQVVWWHIVITSNRFRCVAGRSMIIPLGVYETCRACLGVDGLADGEHRHDEYQDGEAELE